MAGMGAWEALAGDELVRLLATRVGGDGPVPCDTMLISDFPSLEEGRRGYPFAGKAGRELGRYLNGYERPRRGELYLTNLSKQVTRDTKSFRFSETDAADLQRELDLVRPSLIVALGHHAVRHFLGDVTLEAVHGIPHAIPDLPGVTCLPGFNPAAMLHSPNLQAIFAQDMLHWSLYLKGELPAPPEDARPGEYVHVHPAAPLPVSPVIAMDSEGWTHDPWCLSLSGVAYTGAVVRYGQHEAHVQQILRARPRIVIHNSLHDFGVFRAFGLDIDAEGLAFDDTMIMAYLLGLEPQGLKPLAYRHAGMRMSEYSEITHAAGEANAAAWLVDLAEGLPDKPKKLLKREAVAAGLWPAKGGGKYTPIVHPPLGADDLRRAHAKSLILRALDKPDELRKRWGNGTAREILCDELGDLSPFEADPPEATLDQIPLEQAVAYAARDADATLRIYPHLSRQIDAYGLRDVYETDLAMLPMIDRMQTVGLKVDLPYFRDLSAMLQILYDQNQETLRGIAGRDVNPNSGDQIAALLFDELRVHQSVVNLRLKKTASGRFSTDDKTLEAIEGLHPVVPVIRRGREIRKLKGTYCDPMPRLVKADGRLHPNYRVTRTETGRLSAGDPNVLAFPKHSDLGKLVRMGFIADEGHELGSWDLAQIEMCVFAHDSADATMIAEILSGIDKHSATAAGIFGRRAEDIEAERKAKAEPGSSQRFAAKAVNFGILMGITEYGLLDQFHKNGQLDYTLDRCQELLREWFRRYPAAKAYIEKKHAEARRHGFVRDMWGRLRWLEGIHSDDDYIRAEAERQAQATPVQSGAQGIIKRVMGTVWPALTALRQDFWIEPLLQVHDALDLEYDARHRDTVNALMLHAMTQTVQLRVPIRASADFGVRWGDL